MTENSFGLLSAKSLCEEFARLKGFTLKLVKRPWYNLWYVRLRYGRYCMKYIDGAESRSPGMAYRSLAEKLCNPELCNPCGFNGWSHFGKCSSLEELALKMAVSGCCRRAEGDSC